MLACAAMFLAMLGFVRYQTMPRPSLWLLLHKSTDLMHLRRVHSLLAAGRLLPSDLRAEPMLAASRVLKIALRPRTREAKRRVWRTWPAWVALSSVLLVATTLSISSTTQHPRATYKLPSTKPWVPVNEKALDAASRTVADGPGPTAVVLGGIASELVKGEVRTYVKQGRTWILENGG